MEVPYWLAAQNAACINGTGPAAFLQCATDSFKSFAALPCMNPDLSWLPPQYRPQLTKLLLRAQGLTVSLAS